MAKLCVVCGSLCAYFLLFFGIRAVLSIDDYHFYNTEIDDHSSKYQFTTKLLDNEEHILQKRDVENNQSNSPTRPNGSTVPPKPNDTVLAQNHSSDSVSVANKTATDNKISKTKLSKTTKIAPPPATKGQLEESPKLLGVNGTGQRKNITSPKPTLLPNHTISPITVTNATTPKNGTDEDITINKFPEDEESETFNKTLAEHNITTTRNDTHIYYNSSLNTDPGVAHYYWVDLTNRSETKVNDLLSRSHRRAATVQLSFEFPFYGHLIKNVTIATGGFLYTGDYVHSWLAATQYIAPLMANFDTSISNDSYIRYVDNGTAFTVEWDRVALQDKPNEGEFTFQATLHKNGDIVFVYQNVPLFIKSIEDDHHPVKVGLSDAYIIDRTIFLVRRKTIYEYHRINFLKEDIKNWTVIYLKALPTCLQNENCSRCTTSNIPSFQCYWCPTTNSCSSGVDRNRQVWLSKGCETKHLSNESMCSHISGADIFDDSNTTYNHDANEFQHKLEGHYAQPASALGPNQPVKMGVSSIVAILFLIAMVAGLAVWVLYAYRNPHTTSGQILIRYRPSQWRWRRGEARYTAATIHM